MDNKLHILRHSLGLDQNGRGKQYRNHFVTGDGSNDFPFCRELVANGFMTERAGSELSGGDSVFYVTPSGVKYAHSGQPIEIKPSGPKPTICHKHG